MHAQTHGTKDEETIPDTSDDMAESVIDKMVVNERLPTQTQQHHLPHTRYP